MPFMLELDFLGRLQADKAKAVAMLGRAWNLACQSKTLSMEVRRDILFDFICALREAGQTPKAESLMPMYRGLAACL